MSADDTLAQCAAGTISPAIALSRLLLAGTAPDPAALRHAASVPGGSPALAEVAALAERHRDRLPGLQRLVAGGLTPDGEDRVAATGRLFDRLAVEAPEAAVAFYSFGDPDALAAATAELVEVVRSWASPAGRRVLDVGCGIGRLSLALADEAAEVVGLDLSPGMVAEARRRAGDRPRLRFLAGDAAGLDGIADGSVDLVIAADSLPFVVGAGLGPRFLASAARVLAPGGDLLVFNWSYRGDAEADLHDVCGSADLYDLTVVRAGEHPFHIWDAVGFHLRKP